MSKTIMPDIAAEFRELIGRVKTEIHKVIVGQESLVDLTLQCMFCHNHALLMGVPGLAKTLLVTTIGQVIGISTKRVQFTPDLMPSDITGTEIIQEDPVTGRKEFVFMPGPIFANMVLADEINRTPPKTQAALLEAMQEKQVRSGIRDTSWICRFLCWPPRTRSNRKEPTICPRRSSTASCT